jgi:hypothetical protein
MPAAPRSHRATGSPPAAVRTSSRIVARSRVGSRQSNQIAMRMPVAEVDHGSDATTPTAHQSARSVNAMRAAAVPSRCGTFCDCAKGEPLQVMYSGVALSAFCIIAPFCARSSAASLGRQMCSVPAMTRRNAMPTRSGGRKHLPCTRPLFAIMQATQ